MEDNEPTCELIRETISVRKYKIGYEVRTENVTHPDDPEHTITMKTAYTLGGDYVGTSQEAHRLYVKFGIKPEMIDGTKHTCSIGLCEKEQKWFGWSHRAIYGFGIGDTVKEGDCAASSGYIDEYIAEHPEADLSLPVGFEAKTLDDAKKMAMAFADSVG